MEPAAVKELLTDQERFAPDVDEVWSAVEAATNRRSITRRRFVIGGVAAGVAAIAAGATLAQQRPDRVALPGPSPTVTPPATSPSTARSTSTGTTGTTGVTRTAPAPLVPVAALAKGRWTAVPTAPIPAPVGGVCVWTGTEMLVWGGSSNNQPSVDGAAYDPARRRWRTLPPAPAAARANWTGIWTGDSLILWGVARTGQDTAPTGARYTPATDSWQMLPDAPIGVSSASTTVWTGSAMIALTVPAGDHPQTVVAARYDPTRNRWDPLASVPLPAGHPVQFVQAVAAARVVYLWSRWQNNRAGFQTAGTDAYALQGTTWRPITYTGGSEIDRSLPIWTGTSLIQPASRTWAGINAGPDPAHLAGRLINLPDQRVTEIAPGPLDHQAPQTLWTGNALISLTSQGAAAAWDQVINRWTALPRTPLTFEEDPLAVWTGTSLLIWGKSKQPTKGTNTATTTSAGFQLNAP